MTKPPTNLPASVRDRLLQRSRQQGEDFMLTLTRYAVERFLYRLSLSPHAEKFVLKGAALFAVWAHQPYRPTRDVDFLGKGESSAEALRTNFTEICQTEVAEDGLIFVTESIRITEIREEQEYPGQRVQLTAMLGKASIPVQVDIGFGDAVFPVSEFVRYPTLLDLPAPQIYAYPKESVVAEKLQAMVALGRANSRMKDYADLLTLSQDFPFEGSRLAPAIGATFERRKTGIPRTTPDGLSDAFGQDPEKARQWEAFRNRNDLDRQLSLGTVVARIRQFVELPMLAAADAGDFTATWTPGGPWR